VIAAPFLLIMLYLGQFGIFKWFLFLSFFTDFIDGFLARKFKVASVFGTRMDSIGDDLTVMVAMIGLFVIKPMFIKEQKFILIIIGLFFILQTVFALIRYGRITSFHTYLAKIAALLQAVFLLLVFFTAEPNLVLFYTAVVVTITELIEETILVYLLPKWRANVKGLYWVLKNKNGIESSS
jgi:CDP-diacylglycerol--glycerol-3-phosphate 3-phosphatidyltransferase